MRWTNSQKRRHAHGGSDCWNLWQWGTEGDLVCARREDNSTGKWSWMTMQEMPETIRTIGQDKNGQLPDSQWWELRMGITWLALKASFELVPQDFTSGMNYLVNQSSFPVMQMTEDTYFVHCVSICLLNMVFHFHIYLFFSSAFSYSATYLNLIWHAWAEFLFSMSNPCWGTVWRLFFSFFFFSPQPEGNTPSCTVFTFWCLHWVAWHTTTESPLRPPSPSLCLTGHRQKANSRIVDGVMEWKMNSSASGKLKSSHFFLPPFSVRTLDAGGS